MFSKSLTGEKHINATTITADSVNTKSIVDEDGLSFETTIKTGNLIDNHKELLSSLKPLGTSGTGTFNTIAPHAEGSRANDCIVVFEHDENAVSHHFISCKLQDNIIKIDKIHPDVLGVVADNSATKLLKTNDAYTAFHSADNETSGKWIFTTEPVYKTGGVEYVLQHATSSNVVGHHATTNSSSLHPKIGATGAEWQKSAGAGVGAVQYIVVNNTNGQLQTETKKQTYHKDNYKPSNYSESDILVVAGNDLHKASPYFILTTDTDGKILGKYIYDSVFSMFPMGSTAGGADARPSADRYKQGLVPEGSATHNNTYLRKDGTWGTPIDTNTDTNTFVNPTSVVALGGISNGSKITDDDADNFFEFGRGKIGFNGEDGDDFCIAHRDNFTTTKYALKQDADGTTLINAKTGVVVGFRVNDVSIAFVSATALVSNFNILSNITSGEVLTSNDADLTATIGRGKIGYNGADSDDFCIAHRDYFSNVNYALKQDADGGVNLNAPTGKAITFKINDALKEVVDANSHTFLNNVVVGSSNNIQLQKTSGTNITSTDNDTIYEFGRAKVGYMGHSDWAGFGHRDRFSITDCAIFQSMNGDTIVNAPTGACVNFRIANVSSAVCCVNDFTFNSNIIVDASHTLSLLKTSGSILTTTDNDTIFELGRAKIGYVGYSDWAGFSHRDNFTTTSYALLNGANGDTLLNAKSGQVLHLRINNVSSATIDANDFTFNSNAVVDASHKLGILKTSGSILTTSDNDTICELGRGKLGYNGNDSDEFCIAHRDHFTNVSYALIQNASGETSVNAVNGTHITFRINDSQRMRLNTNTLIMGVNIEVNNSHIIDMRKSSGTIFETIDADTIFEFGRGKLGYATNSDEFVIAHRDNFTSANCALVQDEAGMTILNAKSGQLVKIGINDTPVIEVDANTILCKGNVNINSSHKLEIDMSSGTCIETPDANTIYEFGRAKVGYVGHNDYAGFGHRDIFNTSQYCLINSPTGDALLNAGSTSKCVYIRVVNQTRLKISNTLITHYVNLYDGSDKRIKDEIEDVGDYWEAFKSIKLKTYKKVIKGSNDKRRIGVIADEIEVNENDVISNSFNQGDEDENDELELKDGTKITAIKSVEYQQLYRMSMAVVQQLQTRIEALEKKLDI